MLSFDCLLRLDSKEMDSTRSAMPCAGKSGGIGELAEFGESSEHFSIVWIRNYTEKSAEGGDECILLEI